MNELWLVGVVAGGAGAAVGGPLLFQRQPRGEQWTTDRLVGLWIVGAASAMLLVGLRHGGLFAPGWDIAVEHLTNAASIVAWTVLVMLTRRIAGLDPAWPSRAAEHLVLPAVYLAMMLAAGLPDIRFVWLLPVGFVAVIAIGSVWWRVRARADSDIARQSTAVFVFAVVYCAAQAVRSFWPRVTALREIVPLVTTASFFAISFALAGRRLTPARAVYAKSGLSPLRAQEVMARIDAGMRDHAWYREPGLTLAVLAGRVALPAYAVSQALNQSRRQSLLEYLAEWRVRDAKRQLQDPAHDCFSIEGIARASGFASRSAFYRAFREAEGETPTQFRKRTSGCVRPPAHAP
jgi:AraC-like DNA-binding protein